MSTDFNIKPVGAPVAAPMASAASQTAQKAVQTELPASQSVTAAEPSVRVSIDQDALNASLSSQSTTKDQVIIDRDAGAVVYQVVDNRTNLVVRQFPEEAALRRRAYFHTLDLGKDAPTRAPGTDRRV
jgi:uncharacterized FlaG/YvyC family protein